MKRLTVLFLLFAWLSPCAYNGYLLFETDPTKAGSAPSSLFPLTISGTYPAFATVSNGGKVFNTTTCGPLSIACPADLMFSADPGCSGPIGGWEIVNWSASTGSIAAVVQIPRLSNTKTVSIFACIGNSAVTTWQGGLQGAAWDSSYMLAYHMEETTGTLLYDSTSNGNNAVKKASANPATAANGIVGRGQSFSGTPNSTNNDYAQFTTPTASSTNYTIEYWAQPSAFKSLDAVFLENSSGSPNVFTAFGSYPSGSINYWDSWSASLTPIAPNHATIGVYSNIVFVRTGDTMNVYVNGVVGIPVAGFGTSTESWTALGWTGGPNPLGNSFSGTLDEVAFSGISRDSSYIIARYNNLSSPSTFYTVSGYTISTPAPPSTTPADSQATIY